MKKITINKRVDEDDTLYYNLEILIQVNDSILVSLV